jgi:hypothetical protein
MARRLIGETQSNRREYRVHQAGEFGAFSAVRILAERQKCNKTDPHGKPADKAIYTK